MTSVKFEFLIASKLYTRRKKGMPPWHKNKNGQRLLSGSIREPANQNACLKVVFMLRWPVFLMATIVRKVLYVQLNNILTFLVACNYKAVTSGA